MSDIPDPSNPLQMLVQFFLALFFALSGLFGGVNTASNAPSAPDVGGGGGGGMPPAQVLTLIENVDAMILESLPAQVTLHVRGAQPDGCAFPVIVEQAREGNKVTVKIYRELPPDLLCTMVLLPYDENIQLDGTFDSGTYQIDVNGTVIEITI